MIGYLNSREAARYLGGRSLRWLRSHLHKIPHRRLYGQLLFDPMELRKYVEATATRPVYIDVQSVVSRVVGHRTIVRKGSDR